MIMTHRVLYGILLHDDQPVQGRDDVMPGNVHLPRWIRRNSALRSAKSSRPAPAFHGQSDRPRRHTRRHSPTLIAIHWYAQTFASSDPAAIRGHPAVAGVQ